MAVLQYQIIQRPVADVTTLKALDVTLYSDGAIITVKAKGIYRYDPLSAATPDDDKVVQPTVGSGRWLRMTDAEIDEHTESFLDLDDTPSSYATTNAIYTVNDTDDGVAESGGTLSSAGALKVVSTELSLGSVVNEISNDTTLEDKSTALITEHVAKDIKDNAQPLDADLTALAALSTDGMMARTGTATYATRTITGTLNQVNVNDGDGVSGNPILSTPQDIATTSSPTFASLSTTGNINGASPTEMGYLSGVTSSIQTQLNAKAASFDGDQVFWVSGNGNDTANDGKSENEPFLTIGKARTEAGALTPASGNEIAIVCLEGTDFTEDINVDSYVHVYFPNATLNGQITIEGNGSIKLKNIKYSGTGVAVTRTGGGIGPGYVAAELISCTSTGDAIENASGNLELAIDRVEVNNGNGFQITGTAFTYTSGYINYMECINGGNGIDVSGLNVLSFGLHIGRLSAENSPGQTGISLTSNATINLEVTRLSGDNAYVVNSSGAELNLSVTKLYGTETVTAGTVNIVNPSGNNSFSGGIQTTGNINGATPTEIGYLSGVTSAIQTQLNSKLSNVSDDTSPQLGGNLDANSKDISSVASINTVTWPAAGGSTNDVLTLTGATTAAWQPPSGGGGLPDQVNTYYVGKNGNDSNDGLQLGEPKLTLTSANTAAGSTTSKFYITDIGTYTGDSFTTIADSVYDCRGATFSNSNIFLKAGASFSCHKFLVTSGDGIEKFSSADSDPSYFNANIVSNSGSGRAIVHLGNDSNIQYYRIGLLLHSSSNSCVTHQLGTACFDIDEVRATDSATGNIFNLSGGLTTHTHIHIKKLDASGMNSTTPAFVVSGSVLYLEYDELIGVSSTYDLFSVSSTGVVYLNGKNITNALVDVSSGDVKYYNLDTALMNFNPPKNLLVSGDFSKIPLWVKGIGLSSFSDADPVTPSFLVLSSTTVDVQRNTSNQNELVLQLTGSGYLGGYEPLYEEEFSTYLTDLKNAGETLSIGMYGRATGITSIKFDIIQWVPSTDDACLQDPVSAWGATPTLDSDATGAWSYVASSSSLTISGSNSLIKWENISLSSFNTSATRLGLLIRTSGSESSGDSLIIKKLAMHRGYKFVGFEDRDEVKKTETRIATSYNNNITIGASNQTNSAVSGTMGYEAEPNMAYIAAFDYNTTLLDIPAAADFDIYNPVTGDSGQFRDYSNDTNHAYDSQLAWGQHTAAIMVELSWDSEPRTHFVIWPMPYQ